MCRCVSASSGKLHLGLPFAGPNPYHETDQAVMLLKSLSVNNETLQLLSSENGAGLCIDCVGVNNLSFSDMGISFLSYK